MTVNASALVRLPGLSAIWRQRIRRVVLPGEDLAAIVNAIGSNSEIILAAGTHTASAMLLINNKSDVTIRGGPEAVLVSTQITGIRISGACNRIVLKGFTYRFGGANYAIECLNGGSYEDIRVKAIRFQATAPGADAAFYANQGTNQKRIRIEDCVISGTSWVRGIYFNSIAGAACEDCVVKRNFITGPTLDGIRFVLASGTTSLRHHVIGNRVVSAGQYGITMERQDGCLIRGNIVDGSAQDGIRVTTTSLRMSVMGNHVRSNAAGNSILVSGGYSHLVIGNVIYNSGNLSINVQGTAIVVNGNRIAGSASHGIAVGVSSEYVTINGNAVSVTGGSDGISIGGGAATECWYCNIAGNTIERSAPSGAPSGIRCVYMRESLVRGNVIKGFSTGITEDANSDQNLFGHNHVRNNTVPTAYAGTNRTVDNDK